MLFRSYWIKVTTAGQVKIGPVHPLGKALPKQVQAADDFSKMNQITLTDRSGSEQALYVAEASQLHSPVSSYEMPPASPGFDARFITGRMVESYSKDAPNGQYQISLQGATYPLAVHYDFTHLAAGGQAVTIKTDKGQLLASTSGKPAGTLLIKSAAVKGLSLTLGAGAGNLPKVYALSQNYPNPFNPSTHFNVDVPRLSNVSVVVYDILGQKIATLLTGEVDAGKIGRAHV